MKEADALAALRTVLDGARGVLCSGDAPEAERLARAVAALVRAERDLAEFAIAMKQSMEEDDEAMRAELRRRFDQFLVADREGRPADELGRLAREMFAG